MRVEAIEPLERLSDAQVELLHDVLRDRPAVDQAALVLYRLRDGDRSIDMIAPASPDLERGMEVIAAGWVVGAQVRSSDPGEEGVDLHVAQSLVRD